MLERAVDSFRKWSGVATLAVVMIASASCAKKDSGEASKVKTKLLTEEPIVILSDFLIPSAGGEEETTIDGPWFLASFEYINTSTTKYVAVAELSFVAETTLNGARQVGESEISNESEDPTFFVVLPGQTLNYSAYFYGLPETDTRIYNMRIKMRGWMGTYVNSVAGAPDEVFEREFFFTTK